MNAKKVLLISGASLFAVALGRYVYRNILLANKWDFFYKRFEINQVYPSPIVTVTIEFKNVSDLTVTIKDIDISVFTEDVQIGKVFQPEQVVIAPNGSTEVKFKLEFSAGNAIKGWSTLIANAIKNKDLPMDFVGTFKTKTLFGFLSVPVRYSTTGKNLYQLWKTYYG